MGDENKVVVIICAMCFIVVMAIIASMHYSHNILPKQMADKGYCWKQVTSQPISFGWVPCTTPQTPEAK